MLKPRISLLSFCITQIMKVAGEEDEELAQRIEKYFKGNNAEKRQTEVIEKMVS